MICHTAYSGEVLYLQGHDLTLRVHVVSVVNGRVRLALDLPPEVRLLVGPEAERYQAQVKKEQQ